MIATLPLRRREEPVSVEPTRRSEAVKRLAIELASARDEIANAPTAFERQMWMYHATNIERIIKEVGERDAAERKEASK